MDLLTPCNTERTSCAPFEASIPNTADSTDTHSLPVCIARADAPLQLQEKPRVHIDNVVQFGAAPRGPRLL